MVKLYSLSLWVNPCDRKDLMECSKIEHESYTQELS